MAYCSTFKERRAKRLAPGEARTHGLQIMRLTRCLLRYGGGIAKLSTRFLQHNPEKAGHPN